MVVVVVVCYTVVVLVQLLLTCLFFGVASELRVALLEVADRRHELLHGHGLAVGVDVLRLHQRCT